MNINLDLIDELQKVSSLYNTTLKDFKNTYKDLINQQITVSMIRSNILTLRDLININDENIDKIDSIFTRILDLIQEITKNEWDDEL